MALTRPPPRTHESAAPELPPENTPTQNADAAMRYCLKQGVIGGLYGLLGSSLFSYTAHRYSSVYRTVGLPGKLIIVTAATCGAAVFSAERAVYYFNRPFLEEAKTEQSEASRAVPNVTKLADFALAHRFEIVGGLSASSVLGAVLYVARDRNKTASEKFMSIRLFSHAAALMALLGAVGVGTMAAQKKHLEREKKREEAKVHSGTNKMPSL